MSDSDYNSAVQDCILLVCPLCRYAADTTHDGIPVKPSTNGRHVVGDEHNYWSKECAAEPLRKLLK